MVFLKKYFFVDLHSHNPPSPEIEELCNEFFHSKISDLSTCFARVPKDNFLQMCMNSSTTLEACRSAVGYIEMCHRENTPLNIPDSCIKYEKLLFYNVGGRSENNGNFQVRFAKWNRNSRRRFY